jgi:hypothetical protein
VGTREPRWGGQFPALCDQPGGKNHGGVVVDGDDKATLRTGWRKGLRFKRVAEFVECVNNIRCICRNKGVNLSEILTCVAE